MVEHSYTSEWDVFELQKLILSADLLRNKEL